MRDVYARVWTFMNPRGHPRGLRLASNALLLEARIIALAKTSFDVTPRARRSSSRLLLGVIGLLFARDGGEPTCAHIEHRDNEIMHNSFVYYV